MVKMSKILGVAVIAAVAMAAVAPAEAGCPVPRAAGTFGNGNYVYWFAPGPANEGAVAGRFWQQGDRILGNEGTCQGFMYFSPVSPPNGLNFYQLLGDACVTGCPNVRMLAVAMVPSVDNKKTYFLAASIDQVLGPSTDFAYENLGDLPMAELPKPFVASSARAGSNVDLVLNLPSVMGGVVGVGSSTSVQGYRVLSATGGTDPGRQAAAYPSVGATVPSTGGAVNGVAVSVDCSNPAVDRWVVTQVVWDQGVQADLVSEAVHVNCNPSIAEPGMPTIDKPGKGKGRPSNRP